MKLRSQVEKQKLQLKRGQVGNFGLGGKADCSAKENIKPTFGSKDNV
jgi:hypothetical protein